MTNRYAHIHISHTALRHNLAVVRQYAPSSKVLAMVKANAYGHGIANVLPALQSADAFGVACMQEAVILQETMQTLGIHKPICLIEGVFSEAEWLQAQAMNAMCAIHQQAQLDWAIQYTPTSHALKPNASKSNISKPNVSKQEATEENAAKQHTQKQTVWLKVNTGMNRLGLSLKDALPAYQALSHAGYHIILCMHYANADDPSHPLNAKQQQTFTQLVQQITQLVQHAPALSVCNSAATVNWQAQHHDWVRTGIMLYGSSPVITHTAAQLGLRPAMCFYGKIFSTYQVQAGDYVGYGSKWQASEDTTVGIVSVGYGDGYPRCVQHAQVYCKGQLCSVIGRVSMDMLVIDITHAADIKVHDTVELWGEQLPIDTVAQTADTISYELLCKVTDRPARSIEALD